MLGDQNDKNNKGIIGRAVHKIFETKNDLEDLYRSRGGAKIEILVELIEIYNESVQDLLNSVENDCIKAVKIGSHAQNGNGIFQTNTEDAVMHILDMAQKKRAVKATSSNAASSRSHMLFTLHFSASLPDGIKRSGTLNICDLAGSERLGKSGANEIVRVSFLL